MINPTRHRRSLLIILGQPLQSCFLAGTNVPYRNGTWLNIQRDSQYTLRVSKELLTELQYYQEFADAVNYITVTKGAYCILDPHNYMRYNNPSQQPTTGSIIGDTTDLTAATTADFATFWATLAGRFKSNEKVIFGLMNEVCCCDKLVSDSN